MQDAAGPTRLFQRPLHVLEGAPVDERTNERSFLARIADFGRGVDRRERRQWALIDLVRHKRPRQRRAALARRAHGREGDGADCEIEIGRGRDDGSVVAAELKDRTGEAGGETWADVA